MALAVRHRVGILGLAFGLVAGLFLQVTLRPPAAFASPVPVQLEVKRFRLPLSQLSQNEGTPHATPAPAAPDGQ